MQRGYPPLWQRRDTKEVDRTNFIAASTTCGSLLEQFSSNPRPKRWSNIFKSSLVVGQEFAISCYFLARHRRMMQREDQSQLRVEWKTRRWSLVTLLIALILVVALRNVQRTWSSHHGRNGRLVFFMIQVGYLTLLVTMLKVFFDSHFSRTIHYLATTAMLSHFFGCDYSYAYGMINKVTQSAPLSNSALLAISFLASRLHSLWTILFFVSKSVAVSALYPVVRHDLYRRSPQKAPFGKLSKNYIVFSRSFDDLGHWHHDPYQNAAHHHFLWYLVTLLSIVLVTFTTWDFLERRPEKVAFTTVLFTICLVAPSWKYYLQRYKVHISGPWDIPHITIHTKQTQMK